LAQGFSTHHAVPFSELAVTVALTDKRAFPKELKTIGDHIKQARLERKMLIKDVIAALGICRWTHREWEHNNLEPFVYHYPKIIAFLGYYPFDHETESLGGKIKKYRFMHGLSLADFGKLVGMVGSTVSTWERNKAKPIKAEVFMKLTRFLEIVS
jgi:DNA-binding transcriptional regulator YiaG